jgi:hypothetical protein
MVLQTRGISGSGIFDSGSGDISGGGSGDDGGTDGYAGNWGTGTGGTRLVLFSCSRLVWVLENTVQGVRGTPLDLSSFRSLSHSLLLFLTLFSFYSLFSNF